MAPSVSSLVLCIYAVSATATAQIIPRQATATAASYDYIIVGGGTAGLVMASRLSENSSVSVAVIEAGGDPYVVDPTFRTTPALDGDGIGADPVSTNSIDWNFVTAPQKGANNRQVHYARGKCLGGTSMRNYMMYQRGTKGTYDSWAALVGDSSYTFDNLLPYFKKSVTFTPPANGKRFPNATAQYNAAAFSPSGGPLHVSYANYGQPWSTWGRLGLNSIGIADTQDFNSGSVMGAQWVATTINPAHQTRDSSESSFLAAAAGRPNLHVFNNTMAKKILFAKTKATGVQVLSKGATTNLQAKREVIVSAGAFQSPQLLMVSGVGPKRALSKLNIPVVVDRPGVGQGMQDHVFFGPSYRVNLPTITRLATDSNYVSAQINGEYQRGLGPLTNNGADFVGWEKVPEAYRRNFSAATKAAMAQFHADWPELELYPVPLFTGNFSNLAAIQPTDGYMYASLITALVAPVSRGSVTISSADTAVAPIIDPGFLTAPADQDVALAAFKRARDFFATKAVQPVLIGGEYDPGPRVSTDAQILQWIRNNVMTVWHASCTCAMGKSNNPLAVVDSHARVIGVSNLRVVDASAFPILPPGHPQSTVYALAEKISDMIKHGN